MSVAAPSFVELAGHISEIIRQLSSNDQKIPVVHFGAELGHGVKISYTGLGEVHRHGDTSYSTGGDDGRPGQTWHISHGPIGTLYRLDPSSGPVITTSPSQHPSQTVDLQDQPTNQTQAIQSTSGFQAPSEQTSQSQNTTQSGSLHPYYKFHEWAEQDDKRAKFANLCARRMMDAGTARETDDWAKLTTSFCKDLAEKYSHRTREANPDWMTDMSRDLKDSISRKTACPVKNCEPTDMKKWMSEIEGDETRLKMFHHAGNLTNVLERFEEKARKNPTASNDEITASVESSMTGLWGTKIERNPFGGEMGVTPDRPSFLSQATSLTGSLVKGLLKPKRYPFYAWNGVKHVWNGAKYLVSSSPERVTNPFLPEGSDRFPSPSISDSSVDVFSSAVTSAQKAEQDADSSDDTTPPRTSRWNPSNWFRRRLKNNSCVTSVLSTAPATARLSLV